MTDIWEARRDKLEEAVRAAALKLLDHLGEPVAFWLELLPNNPGLIVIAGPLRGVRTFSSVWSKRLHRMRDKPEVPAACSSV